MRWSVVSGLMPLEDERGKLVTLRVLRTVFQGNYADYHSGRKSFVRETQLATAVVETASVAHAATSPTKFGILPHEPFFRSGWTSRRIRGYGTLIADRG